MEFLLACSWDMTRSTISWGRSSSLLGSSASQNQQMTCSFFSFLTGSSAQYSWHKVGWLGPWQPEWFRYLALIQALLLSHWLFLLVVWDKIERKIFREMSLIYWYGIQTKVGNAKVILSNLKLSCSHAFWGIWMFNAFTKIVGPSGVRALPLAAGRNVGGHYK